MTETILRHVAAAKIKTQTGKMVTAVGAGAASLRQLLVRNDKFLVLPELVEIF